MIFSHDLAARANFRVGRRRRTNIGLAELVQPRVEPDDFRAHHIYLNRN